LLENSPDTSGYRLRSKRPTLRLNRFDRLDGRTSAARYARKLMRMWTKVLTADGRKLTEVDHTAIRYAACCVVLSDDATSRRMCGDESVTLTEVTRLQNSAIRAIARLHLPTKAPEPETGWKWTLK